MRSKSGIRGKDVAKGLECVSVLLILLAAAGCATTDGILMLDPDGKARDVTPEEVDAFSGEGGPYLLQVGDQVNLTFLARDYRKDEVPWDYRIEIGDTMEVRLTSEVGDGKTYQIDVGDLVGVSFLNNWQLNGSRTVRPDGMITMPEVGDVKAAGSTAADLQARLVALYKKTGIIEGDPNISVNVEFANPDRLENMSRDVVVRPDGSIRIPAIKNDVRIAGMTLNEASEAVRAEAAKILRNPPVVSLIVFPSINTVLGGMNGVYTVRPDGKVSVPRVGELQAAGYSTDELRENLNARCTPIIFNTVDTAVDVVTVTGSRVYVGGEVGVPGVYPLASTPTALQAVLMAHGTNNASRLNSVLVMRRNPNGKPYVFRTNLRAALQGRTENDIVLRPFDVVYVPKKLISRANLFVEQYIEEMVPFENQLGVTATYYLNPQEYEGKTKSRNYNYGVNAPTTTSPISLGTGL